MATWNVTNCDYAGSLNGKANVVTHLHWDCTDEDEVGNAGRIYGSVSVPTDNIQNFVEWENVSETQCIEWTKEALGEDGVAEIEKQIADMIEEQRTPTVKQGVPWHLQKKE